MFIKVTEHFLHDSTPCWTVKIGVDGRTVEICATDEVAAGKLAMKLADAVEKHTSNGNPLIIAGGD